MKRAASIIAVVLSVGCVVAGWRGRFDEQFAQLFGGATGPLPAGWTECEYLESTGTQFLNVPTGLLTTNSFFYFEYQVVSNIVGRNNGIFGTTSGNRYGSFIPLPGLVSEHRNFYGGVSSRSYNGGNQRLSAVWEHPTMSFYINDVLARSLSVTDVGTNPGTPFWLFAIYPWDSQSAMRCWNFTLKDRGAATNRINLVPALDTNGVPCMFDTVTQTPLYNAGTGDFLYKIKEH